MIDIEDMVFDRVTNAVLTKYPYTEFSQTEERIPPSFPFVSIVEADNSTYENTLDSSGKENHASVMYEVNTYSNKAQSKKNECKGIFKIIDREMLSLGFIRTMTKPITNDTATDYRILARYTAVVSKDFKLYRR